MGRLAQVGWNKSVEQRLAELLELLHKQAERIKALEAKRGPGRPPNERKPTSGD